MYVLHNVCMLYIHASMFQKQNLVYSDLYTMFADKKNSYKKENQQMSKFMEFYKMYHIYKENHQFEEIAQ